MSSVSPLQTVLAELHDRRRPLRQARLRRLAATLLLASACGCTTGLMNLPSRNFFALPDLKEKKAESSSKRSLDDNDFASRVETPLLSEYISVQGNNLVVLRGVGLVTGLDGTGDNPPPSALRTALKEEMSRRGVKNPEEILASKNTALVVVTAMLPAMVHKGQHFDVRVAIPPNSEATSLKGGWLLETRLFEEQVIEGRGPLKGHNYGVASGAILTELGTRRDPTQISAELRRGSIPGGAISSTERNLSIVLRADKRGYRNAKRVANAVATRFYDYDRYGRRNALAVAKTDTMLELKLHTIYRNNFPRYQQVIRSIAFNESDVARRMRMESLERDIMDPLLAGPSAVQLEAIGEAGVPFLKRALASPEFEVRFHAAQSLAYLGEPHGIETLTTAVREQPALRVYALAALSVIDDADALVALRSLMNEPELETRYGAFRALQELDPNDPALKSVEYPQRFTLFIIDSEGEPMVHVNRRRATEVVLFGANQTLRLPVVLSAGNKIRVIGDGSTRSVTVSKYSLAAEEPEKRVVPNQLSEVIKACGELGATYPDVVQLLIEASQQHNLIGELGIDRLPQAGRMLFRESEEPNDLSLDPSESEDERSGKRVGSPAMIPNLYDRLDEEEIRRQESEDKLSALKFERLARPSDDADSEESDEPDIDSQYADAAGQPCGQDSPGRPVPKRSRRVSGRSAENDQESTVEDADLPEGLPEPGGALREPDSAAGSSNEGSEDEGVGELEEVDMSRMRYGRAARFMDFIRRPFSGNSSESEP